MTATFYVKSRRAGERVMGRLTRFITHRLKLRVNEAKSAVDVPQRRTFLGFTFTGGQVAESTTDRPGIPSAVQGSDTSVDPAELEHQHGGAGTSTQAVYDGLGVGTSGTARRRRYCVIWMVGFVVGCVVCNGNNGRFTVGARPN